MLEKAVKIEDDDDDEEIEVEEVEPYDDDRLVREISESLLLILRTSKKPELRARCISHTGGTNEKEFGEILENKLKNIFRLKKPGKKKKKKPVADASEVKKEVEGAAKGDEEEWSDGSTDWSGISDDNADYDFTRSDYSHFDGTAGEQEFDSDTSVGTVTSMTFMRRMSGEDGGRAAAAAGGGQGWTAPPVYHGNTPATPRPSHPLPTIYERSGDEEHGTPSKMPRLERQSSQSTMNSEWNSDERRGLSSTPEPWSDREQTNGLRGGRIRAGSPMPSRSALQTSRRILGELPLEKDEFDSDSEDEVPTRRNSFSNIHSPPTTVSSPNTRSSPNSSPQRPAWIPQDENSPECTVSVTPFPSYSPAVLSPLTLHTSPSPSFIQQSNSSILVRSSTPPATPSIPSIPSPFDDDSHIDDPDFDSD